MLGKKKEGKLESKVRIFHLEDFALPVVGLLTYMHGQPHPNKSKDKMYGLAVVLTQIGWVGGLLYFGPKYGPKAYDILKEAIDRIF